MKTKRILLETILITAITLLGMLLIPSAKTFFALIPVVYLLIERRLRHRDWGDLGFRIHMPVGVGGLVIFSAMALAGAVMTVILLKHAWE